MCPIEYRLKIRSECRKHISSIDILLLIFVFGQWDAAGGIAVGDHRWEAQRETTRKLYPRMNLNKTSYGSMD